MVGRGEKSLFLSYPGSALQLGKEKEKQQVRRQKKRRAKSKIKVKVAPFRASLSLPGKAPLRYPCAPPATPAGTFIEAFRRGKEEGTKR